MRHWRALGGALIVASVLVGCTDDAPQISEGLDAQGSASAGIGAGTTTDPTPTAVPADGTAMALLDTLDVKGRAARTGYERERFGQAWADVDRNGCDTRNDILRRDLAAVVFKPGTQNCVVLTGRLAQDPYTGREIAFERGGANEVDIDHVVALSNAWQTGAFGWDERKRIAFGNDPANLFAVDATANRQKGDGDAATWLPPARSFRCTYVARQVSVKAKYGLWVTAAERDAAARILNTCPNQPAFTVGALELPPAGLGAYRPPAQPDPQPKQQAATDPRFPHCKDAVPPATAPTSPARTRSTAGTGD